ncbi:MAG: hypothetical protein RIB30_02000 [Thalassospira sp.]|uniref:Spy/CpxP family protein refolding chaperone n=1 Tax=Thalassospira sp. TaxID=1912094 RepID=UPI0032EFEBA3
MFIFSRLTRATVIVMGLTVSFSAQSQEANHGHGHDHGQSQSGHGAAVVPAPASPYAGQQDRSIKSLSPDDIADLRKGGGWGMAKAAELNGVPGTAHLLELADDISLSADQKAAITALYDQMKKDAIEEGGELIAAERALDEAFKAGGLTETALKALLQDIADSRSRLRFIHLATHLKTPAILSPAQISLYNKLRGYEG